MTATLAPPALLDIICPLRPGDDNDEMRWALRTLEAHYPHNRLWIAGYKPRWLTGVEYIPGNHGPTGHANVYQNILAACEHPHISRHAVIINDDFFITEPLDEIPVCYRSTLAEHLELPRVKRAKGQWWPTSLETTRLVLQAHGIAEPLSYELHVPLLVDTHKMAATLRLFQHVTPDNPPQWRSLYGNMHNIGGHPFKDCKAYSAGELRRPFHSTEDRSFTYFAKQLAELFPHPSRYESGP